MSTVEIAPGLVGDSSRSRGAARAVRGVVGSRVVSRVLFAVVLVAVWWIAAWQADSMFFPTPLAVAEEIVVIVFGGDLVRHMGATILRVLVGFGFAFSLSIGLGILMGRSKFFESFLEGAILVGLTIPGLVWALLALMWFGIGEAAPVFAIVVVTVPMLVLNVWHGTKAIEADLLEMSHAFGARRWLTIRDIIIPQLLPYLLAGTRLGFALAWKVVVLSEMFGLSAGVGYMILTGFSAFSMRAVLAWTITFTFVMIALEYGVFANLERRLTGWRRVSNV